MSDRAEYWDTCRAGMAEEATEAALEGAFGWTQYGGHGPGAELLGSPRVALELGCGSGAAVAALAMKGVAATGMDLSPSRCAEAQRRWSHVEGAKFVCADVLTYLGEAEKRWDAIYSIWGAVWFTDPTRLLPLIYSRLAAGGRLVFSQGPPVPGADVVQGMYGDGFRGQQVWIHRWDHGPDRWTELLAHAGFVNICARIVPAPEPNHVGTLLIAATKPSL